jgi:NAD(P)-dependent dehydrogenase (short-subunit alcohol dehydrogenase family)
MTASSGKRALITGASRGIGKAIALALAARGYDVALSARTVQEGRSRENGMSIHHPDSPPLPGSLEQTAADAQSLGVRALQIPLDLTDLTTVEQAGKRVLAEWGGVDVLIHNGRHVGPGLMDVFLDTPIDAYAKFVQAHGIAPVLLTQMLLPGMLDRGNGTIVTMTSKAAMRTPPGPAGKGGWGHAYAVGKASGHPLVLVMQAEFRDKGIRAFNIDPGFVATERNHAVSDELGYDLSRAASPELVGKTVAWIVDSAEADRYAGDTIEAQALAGELGISAP